MAYPQTKPKTLSKGLNRTEGTELLSGTLYFARLGVPLTEINTKEGRKEVPAQYKLSLGLSAAQEKKARELGLYVCDPSESIPQPYVVMKRMVKDDDAEKSRPRIVDENNDPHDPKVLIGNGTRAQVLFRTFGDDPDNQAAAILGVAIQELVEYEKKEAPAAKPTAAPKASAAPSAPVRKPTNYAKKPAAPQPVADDADLDDDIPF